MFPARRRLLQREGTQLAPVWPRITRGPVVLAALIKPTDCRHVATVPVDGRRKLARELRFPASLALAGGRAAPWRCLAGCCCRRAFR